MHSKETEQSLIGSIILDEKCLTSVIQIIEDERYFYEPINQIIYKAIIELFSNCEKIDFIKVLNKICKEDKQNQQEIKNYLLDSVNIVPSISNSTEYAKIIKNKYNIRKIKELSEYARIESTKKDNAEDILEELSKRIEKLIENSEEEKTIKLKNALSKAIEELDKIKSHKDGITGIRTGFNNLDKEISGLNKGELIIIAGRPGMGKTSFALNIATNIAKNHKVIFFSLEMSMEQLALKTIDSELGEQSRKINFDKSSNEKLSNVLENLGNLELYIDDTASETVSKINSKLKKINGTEIIFIDHLQLISGSNLKPRIQEMSEITRDLKILAKKNNIPVVCLSQLSRAPEGRLEKKPGLSDLRDSGSIEQDADIVLMLYRKWYYDKSEKTDEKECECIIAKNRHGTTKTIIFDWDGNITKFSERCSFC